MLSDHTAYILVSMFLLIYIYSHLQYTICKVWTLYSIKKYKKRVIWMFKYMTAVKCRFLIWENRPPLLYTVLYSVYCVSTVPRQFFGVILYMYSDQKLISFSLKIASLTEVNVVLIHHICCLILNLDFYQLFLLMVLICTSHLLPYS